MARVVRFHRHGGPEVLRIEEIEVVPPGRGEVQIQVKALGLNRAEALLRRGTYIETPTLPSGLGLEAAGIVAATGEGVDGFAPGDAVSIVPPVSMVRWPAYGEVVTFPAELVVQTTGAIRAVLPLISPLQAQSAVETAQPSRPGTVLSSHIQTHTGAFVRPVKISLASTVSKDIFRGF